MKQNALIAILFLVLVNCAITKAESASEESASPSSNGEREILSLQQFVERYEGRGSISITVWEKQIFTVRPISTRDCDAEQIQCHRDCMTKTPPWPRKFKGWDHNAYCRG